MGFIIALIAIIYFSGFFYRLITFGGKGYDWRFSKIKNDQPLSFLGKLIYWPLSTIAVAFLLPMYFPLIAILIIIACVSIILSGVL